MIFKTPLNNIRHIMVYWNGAGGSEQNASSMSTIKTNEAPHAICNAALYNRVPFTPCCNELWINGAKKCDGNYPGYALGSGLTWGSHTSTYSGDFIGGFPSYQNGSFPSDFTGLDTTAKTGRAALARSSTDLIYFASTSADFADIETALANEGATNGINLDGGGSLQYNFPGKTPKTSTRNVLNFLLFWFKDQAMPTRKKGNTGWAVSEIQRLLTQKGYPTTVDGIFGSGTEASVKSFQSAKGLTSDGIVGPLTWAQLDA